MDAVKFVKEYLRMCTKVDECEDCPVYKTDFCTVPAKERSQESAEEIVELVEEWSAAHPRKTRQSVFLNLFPDADLSTGTVNVCPNSLYKGKCDCARYQNCLSCKREFWSQEVE